MKFIVALAAASVVSAGLLGARFGRAVWLGMLAPLVVVSATWLMVEQVHRAHPTRVTSVLLGAFAAKMVFFGLYVALAVGVLKVDPSVFMASFAGYFIVLHMLEALWLKRLFVR